MKVKPDQAPPAAAAPSELEGLGAEAAGLDAEHAAPGDPQEPKPADAALPPTDKILAMLLTPAFALLAPNWKVQADEIEQLSLAWAAVVDKYMPDMRSGPELAAALITVVVFAPRVAANVPPKLPKKEPEKKPDDAPPAN